MKEQLRWKDLMIGHHDRSTEYIQDDSSTTVGNHPSIKGKRNRFNEPQAIDLISLRRSINFRKFRSNYEDIMEHQEDLIHQQRGRVYFIDH